MPHRILYICGGRSFYSKRPGRKISSVVACWQKMGYEVLHVCGGDILHTQGASRDQYGSPDVFQKWYRRMPGMNPFVHTFSEWKDMRHDRMMLGKLARKMREWQPHIVWERSSRLHDAGLELAKALGVPYVLEWKDNLVMYRQSLFRRKALQLEERKNQEAEHIVVESNVLREQLMREGVAGSKILVAHNAVQIEEFTRDEHSRKRTRQDLGIDEKTVLVGYLGSYAFYHDTARLVLAADIIRKECAAGKTKILMMGAGKEYPDSRRLAADRGLLDDILILKSGVPQDEVPGVLAALDIAVLPGSTDIICPIKIQEYMACSLPPVAPDYACNREVIDNGRSGMLFRPGDAQDLAAKICALVDDSQMRLKMGREARQEVERYFTWENTWGAALEEVLWKV